jgi:capsular polysaccharide biosynthesis protein
LSDDQYMHFQCVFIVAGTCSRFMSSAHVPPSYEKKARIIVSSDNNGHGNGNDNSNVKWLTVRLSRDIQRYTLTYLSTFLLGKLTLEPLALLCLRLFL